MDQTNLFAGTCGQVNKDTIPSNPWQGDLWWQPILGND